MNKANAFVSTVVHILILTVFWAFTTSCKSTGVENKSTSPNTVSPTESMTISADQAEAIALNSFEDLKNARMSSGKKKTIKKTISLANDEGNSKEPLLHFVNFNEGGYTIISGDKRYPEIMAVVDDGSILDTGNLPGGVREWVQAQKKTLKEMKKSSLKTTGNTSSGRMSAIIPGPSVEPILTTLWGQGCGYNDVLSTTCSDYRTCYKAYTGCVATAMAQVLRKWAYPASLYNWGAMPNTQANSEVGFLMNYAGAAVNMSYGCNESTAYINKIEGAFKNKWGYSSATFKKYGPASQEEYLSDVLNDLNNKRPVIICGSTGSTDYLLFQVGSGSSHCWVSDGYYSMTDQCAVVDTRSNRCFARTSFYLHMNWGWNGDHNGYFVSTNWSADTQGVPMQKDFSYAVATVVNIHP